MNKSILILIWALLLFPFISNGQACLKPKTNYPVQSDPVFLTTTDLNNDGKTDLAVTNQASNSLSILLGNGTGSFSAATNFTVNTYPAGITSGDFNIDGNSDLAISIAASSQIAILLGNGMGGFLSTNHFSLVPGSGPIGISSSDFNNDGKLDLATANIGGDNVSIVFGDGLGNFSSPIDYTVGTTAMVKPSCIIVADVNNDSKSDLITTTQYCGISILLGNGLGSFSSSTNFNAGNYPISVTSGDFNLDGKIDLATANVGEANLSVLLGDGSGNFSAPTTFSTGLYPNSILNCDFNSDGSLDLVTANGSDDISVLIGNNTGSFNPPSNFSVGGHPIAIVTSDFDGDSKPDFAVTNYIPNNVSVLLSNTAPIPTITTISTSTLICAGETATLSASGASSYIWSTTQATSTIIISPTITTTYVVIGTAANGCINFSLLTQSVSACVGINELSFIASEITIFPNPNNGQFTIKSTQNFNLNIINQMCIRDRARNIPSGNY